MNGSATSFGWFKALVLLLGLASVGYFVHGHYGGWVRQAQDMKTRLRSKPVRKSVQDLPGSPTGTYKVQIIEQHYEFPGGKTQDLHELKVWRGEKPFLNGENLDPIGSSRVLATWGAYWQDDSVLAFHNPRVDQGTRSLPLTIENATTATLPFVFICGSTQAYYVFDIPPAGEKKLTCTLPQAGEKVLFAIDDGMGVQEWPARTSSGIVRSLRIRINGKLPEKVPVDFLPFDLEKEIRDAL